MKALIRNSDNVAIVCFDDSCEITLTENNVIDLGYPLESFYIPQLNASTATLVTPSTMPEDYKGSKYKYVNNEWVANEDYVASPPPAPDVEFPSEE